jgi:hypothetical protein
MGLGILGIVLVVGVGISGDTKKDKDTGKKTSPLPPGWKGLMLSKEQRVKLEEVRSGYRSRISALEQQITELKAQEKADMFKVLNEDQKAILLKGLTGETKDKAPTADKKTDK